MGGRFNPVCVFTEERVERKANGNRYRYRKGRTGNNKKSSLAPPSDGSRFIHELAVVNYPDIKKTVYELSIPWAEMFPAGFSITDYSQVLFSVLINDRDNNAREGYYEIGSGIGSSKDPSMHLEYNLMK